MTTLRHLKDRLDFSLFVREPTYGKGINLYASTACQMQDYDDASPHVTWDDMVVTNTDTVTGFEFPTHQEIARQSMTMTYTEPRTRGNTIAGLLALAMGGIPKATKDPQASVFRQALTMGGATSLPSISVRTQYDLSTYVPPTATRPARSTIWRYDGVKVSTITLSNNGPYWQLAATLMGSGRRVPVAPYPVSSPNIPLPIQEPWLRWGNTRFWLRPLSTGKIVVPTVPVQGGSSLTGGTTTGVIDLSCLLRSCQLTVNNNFAADEGYRPCSGMLRGSLHGTRREITAEITFDVDNAYEWRALDTYLSQYDMGFEIDCAADPVVPVSSMRYGFQVIMPRARVTRVTRGQQDQLENLTYAITALEDPAGVIAPLYGWTYNRQNKYLQ